MVSIVATVLQRPYFLSAERCDFEDRVPDLSRGAEIASVFKGGGRLLSPTEIPSHMHFSMKAFRDIFKSNNGVMIISQALYDLLGELDPGAHQMLPINISSNAPSTPRYLLNVHVKQDSVIDDRSDVRAGGFESTCGAEIMYFNGCDGHREHIDVTVDKTALNNLNMWRERRYPSRLLVSDAFCDALTKRRLRFFWLHKAKAV